MANLTITVDPEVLRRARLRALEQGSSVNAFLREQLEAFAGGPGERQRAIQELLDLAAQAPGGGGGRRWTRDELHER